MADRPSRNNRAAPIRLGFGQGGDGQRGGGGGANNGRHPPRRRRNNNNNRRGSGIPIRPIAQAQDLALAELDRLNPNLSDETNNLVIRNMALRDASVRGVDGAGNSLAIPLPRRIGLMALQQQQPWFYFHLHEGRHEIKIIQSDEDGYGRFSNLLRVCHYNDVNNNDTQEPLEVRGVGHLRAFICPVTHERLLVAPMPLTTERRLQGTDYNRVDITISHSLITPQNVENRAFDRHLIANTSDVTRRDYYITNSGIIPIDPCIMPACGEPRMIGTGCAGRCAIHIDRCLDCYTERATVAPHGGHPRFCSGCQRVRNARYR